MNLYLLYQSENRGYDTYDSMVIAADCEEDAKHLSFVTCGAYNDYPNEIKEPIWRNYYLATCPFGAWSETPTIELIAANALVNEGIICTSFNAS